MLPCKSMLRRNKNLVAKPLQLSPHRHPTDTTRYRMGAIEALETRFAGSSGGKRVDRYFREATLGAPFVGKQARGVQRGPRDRCRPSPGGERYRTVFVSDVHLGTWGCKAGALARFLASTPCDTLFLVGDIIDGWRLKRRWYWPEAHTAVLHEILRKVDG